MAFLRRANAVVVHPRTTPAGWGKIRTAKVSGLPTQSLVAQASEILGTSFDPSKFLLTHCTIVASVDVEDVPGVKLGSVKEGNRKIRRKYGNYRVSAATDPYINNNLDCFSRAVLLKSYRTFIGAHNFLEHVQVEDLSKGRIIDAVARDIGDSVYIDILVATDRKHTELVADIESGRLGTLSMGCSVEETICTKCGNVAVDETELCECVKYAKGNMFLDEKGKRHRIAELCGHESLDPTGGVTFIEGSWVASPAFTGAVMRNIITADTLSAKAASRVQEILASPPPQWVGDGQKKAASDDGLIVSEHAVVGRVTDRRQAFDFGDEEPAADAAPAEAPADPFTEIEDRVTQSILDRVEKRIKETLDKKPEPASPESSSMAPNDSLIKEASRKVAREAYAASVTAMVRTASCDADLMNKLAVLDDSFGVKASVAVYRTALAVGHIDKHGSEDAFLKVCRDTLGRPISQVEARALVRLGRILNHAARSASASSVTPDSNRRSLR